MKQQRILIGCEFSGIVRDAFKKQGWDAWSCDLLETERPGQHIQDDVLKHLDDGWDMAVFHPPCTYLAVSGMQWYKPKHKDRFPNRLKDKEKAISFFMKLINAPIPKIAVENPVCIMSTIYRKPDQIIQPWQFGHSESKKTCLWLKNLPLLKPTKIMQERKPKVWRMPPSVDRWKNRSRTYTGIATAMSKQWQQSAIPPLPKGSGSLAVA